MEQIKEAKRLVEHTKIDTESLFQTDRPDRVTKAEDPAQAWDRLTEVVLHSGNLLRNNVFQDRRAPQAAHFDRLRARTLHHMRIGGHKRLAITSPDENCGKTTVAANLALAMARHDDLRVMLFDFDLRKPTLIHHLDLADQGPRFSALLHTPRSFASTTLRVGKNLALSLNATPSETPAEMLVARSGRVLLEHIEKVYAPDVIIFDLPPLLSVDDTLGALDLVDAAILVARADYSTIDQVDEAERLLTEQTTSLGIVLNQSRFG